MYKILVVDDEPLEVQSFIYTLKNKLGDQFEKIEGAYSGREAILKARADFFDIILMDIKMPGINGIEAIEEIKRANELTEIIITTAYDNFDYASKAVTLGARDYLLKPVRASVLIESVNKLIDRIAKRHERMEKAVEISQKYEDAVASLERIKKIYGDFLTNQNEVGSGDENDEYITKADKYIRENFHKDITLEDIAKEVNLSQYYFSHLYKEKKGVTFIDTLTTVRITKARELILKGGMSVGDIAVSVGYHDQSYFSKLFKKITGFSPRGFRQAAESVGEKI